mmetsp:Transcript_5349/g.8410  ORF Transcript_5349/g.8410 Transcript_5349/m.8410 type:complete len:106 (-) Transcript_5349:555-872(-)
MLARVSLRQTQARSGVVASLGARRFFADGMERVPARQQIEGASAHSFNEQGFEEFMDKHHPGAKVKGYHMMGFMLFFLWARHDCGQKCLGRKPFMDKRVSSRQQA